MKREYHSTKTEDLFMKKEILFIKIEDLFKEMEGGFGEKEDSKVLNSIKSIFVISCFYNLLK